ncbi:MAG: nicotinate (nicotinamide) nucleotide adenylyltransferase [Gammaproteobacteria bacterium CG_4_10_14_0_8_um_filter_38_16]|nr:MAG: nicotinate (nicotinamide) nucleotide adenylyltransferase [Gammaproteobacteria bacterium CG_4_10_14_0_8_um_filter_38_16]PJA03446.1 MAG: nicotinate (nicotinamide) nucleotide adenylyltransferase [Gammaproteobacteria bacterium CG_4_10_14_0_2_um_filter_38_22]PJB10601.1 MAG: nicotinate (nicotinamide) nucleotide adenylyltransferase [Gammaproteobacteria bacterium CG_4_9_14_3_um_filter_38_9]
MKKSLGILGGTFNPIHEAHIAIANHALTAFELDAVELIPCFQPPHRETPDASPADRLIMVGLAIKNHPKLKVNDFEIQQKQISYTVNTLLMLHKKMPDSVLYYIVGADAFAQFDTWHQWKKIFSLAHLIVVSRHNKTIQMPTVVDTFLNEHNLKSQLHFLNINDIPVSATQIRKAILLGEKNIAGLNQNVFNYIQEKKLYCENKK